MLKNKVPQLVANALEAQVEEALRRVPGLRGGDARVAAAPFASLVALRLHATHYRALVSKAGPRDDEGFADAQSMPVQDMAEEALMQVAFSSAHATTLGVREAVGALAEAPPAMLEEVRALRSLEGGGVLDLVSWLARALVRLLDLARRYAVRHWQGLGAVTLVACLMYFQEELPEGSDLRENADMLWGEARVFTDSLELSSVGASTYDWAASLKHSVKEMEEGGLRAMAASVWERTLTFAQYGLTLEQVAQMDEESLAAWEEQEQEQLALCQGSVAQQKFSGVFSAASTLLGLVIAGRSRSSGAPLGLALAATAKPAADTYEAFGTLAQAASATAGCNVEYLAEASDAGGVTEWLPRQIMSYYGPQDRVQEAVGDAMLSKVRLGAKQGFVDERRFKEQDLWEEQYHALLLLSEFAIFIATGLAERLGMGRTRAILKRAKLTVAVLQSTGSAVSWWNDNDLARRLDAARAIARAGLRSASGAPARSWLIDYKHYVLRGLASREAATRVLSGFNQMAERLRREHNRYSEGQPGEEEEQSSQCVLS